MAAQYCLPPEPWRPCSRRLLTGRSALHWSNSHERHGAMTGSRLNNCCTACAASRMAIPIGASRMIRYLPGGLEALANWSQGQTAPGNLSKFGQERFKLTGGAQAPSHPAFAAIDALADHQASKQDIRAQLLHALAEISERFDTENCAAPKSASMICSIVLDAALQGQSGERLAKTVREQYPVALIDEFQDTDPVQYRIFESIYRIADNSPDSGLFMIGDPKQAIYAFRGADIYTYLSAREATSGRHYTLGKTSALPRPW